MTGEKPGHPIFSSLLFATFNSCHCCCLFFCLSSRRDLLLPLSVLFRTAYKLCHSERSKEPLYLPLLLPLLLLLSLLVFSSLLVAHYS
jgi:hypothetical protein